MTSPLTLCWHALTGRLWRVLMGVVLLAGCGKQHAAPQVPSSHTFLALGREFQWHFHDLGRDEIPLTEDDVPLGHELLVTPGMDVTLLLTSDDYVYTLTSPTGSKEIAVPKLVHTLRFQAPETGTYEFRTDPMCGLRYFHDDVQGTMQVEASPLRVVVGRK